MATSGASRKLGAADSSAAVDALMATLEHPHLDAIAALREIVCGADASIAEGVKWNAPSFRTTEYFATTHLRAKTGIALILHLGAKVRDIPSVPVDDPQGLLSWLAKDRAMIGFAGMAELRAQAPALQALIRRWIAFV
ncbi:MAG: DUF1801 domain-containing protein [Burkholderiaceae bacterium]|nr:DUF1801 domain-containing protein [Burkholderiaceae bacterium]